MTVVLEADGLGKDYGALCAVDALDLAVEEGEIFGLLGPNGAGKTTAISMMAGVVTPTRGTARVCGHDIARDAFAARAALGMVPQELALYEELSAIENLRFFAGLYGLSGRALGEQVGWALDVAGLTERAREPVARFSGGMKRRLNLVAGLLHRPRVVILDEPTVGVDPQSRNYLFELIRALGREHGMTVLYTSHYMEEVQALCGRVAIVDGGRRIALDSVEALLRAHGGGALELHVGGTAERVRAAIAELGEAHVDGEWLRIRPTVSVSRVLRAVEEIGADVREIRSLENSLETVFLTLTGHTLRDEER